MAEVREIPGDRTRLIMTVDVPGTAPSEVFLHWTDSTLMARWWAPESNLDARPGGAYDLSFPGPWRLHGRYTEVHEPDLLAFTWKWEHTPQTPKRTVEVRMEPIPDGTRVTVHHGTYTESEADQDERTSHLEGWIHFLGRLRGAAGTHQAQ